MPGFSTGEIQFFCSTSRRSDAGILTGDCWNLLGVRRLIAGISTGEMRRSSPIPSRSDVWFLTGERPRSRSRSRDAGIFNRRLMELSPSQKTYCRDFNRRNATLDF